MAGVTGNRQPTGTAFALRDPLPWIAFAGLARRGEELGYASVFLPEIAGRDAFAALTGLAGETRALLLGTGIVTARSRSPIVLAMGAATVHERSGGRGILGLGSGPAVPGALDGLRRTVEQVRVLLAGGETDGRRLSLQPGSRVPIWISALGPKAVGLAGRIADGVLLNWCTPERVADARAAIRESAERTRRDPDGVTIAVYVRASLNGPDEAMPALRAAAGEYASYPAYARQFEAMGLGDEAEAAAAAHGAGRPEQVPEALVRAVCLTAEGARARLQAHRDAGADLPVVYPVAAGGDRTSSIRTTLEGLAPGP